MKRITIAALLWMLLFFNAGSAMAQTAKPAPAGEIAGISRLHFVTLVVPNLDEALAFYVGKLGFDKVQDQKYGPAPGQRWVVVAPKGQKDIGIVLDLPESGNGEGNMTNHSDRIGKEVSWVFSTADCVKTYEVLRSRGVKFVRAPEVRPWGTQAIFEDPYGNQYVLEGPGAKAAKGSSL
ncbi:MAG TPA: VOC family protein [Terriglobales bacterium]|nr:VOC family protein [Terriglobales bacterium]